MTRLIAECSFDYQGKTYEYELSDSCLVDLWGDEDTQDRIDTYTHLYALTEKTVPFPDTPSPKEFSIVRVQRIKPFSEKEFSGDLKKIHHLFFR